VRIAALVPVKHLDRAKKRLDGVLTPDQRRGLVIAMLKDVLAVLTGHRGLDAVHVVTPDETVAAIARQFGARVIDEPPGGGLNAALRHAAERLGGDGFEALLQLPADVPNVDAGDIDRLLAAAVPAPSAVVVPAHDGDGTNGLLVSPPTALAFAFGPGSCRRHQALAREQGIAAVALTLPGLAADIDKPADLAKLQSMPRRGETGRFLDSVALGATSMGEAASPST